MTQAYPLAWPQGWPRTKTEDRKRGDNFKSGRVVHGWLRPISFPIARDKLYDELDRLGAINCILSSNHPVNSRGMASESRAKLADDGIAIYFQYLGKSMVMACDRYDTAAGNMSSLRLAIEAMRQLERHGGGFMMERAFSGFEALSAPGAIHWPSILKLKPPATRDEIEAAFRALARERHPDRGGSNVLMAELNAARVAALKELGTHDRA
jgi:hypothetical protein